MNKEILECYIERVSKLAAYGTFRMGVRSSPKTANEWERCFLASCYHEAGHALTKPILETGFNGEDSVKWVSVLKGFNDVDGLAGTKRVVTDVRKSFKNTAEAEAQVRFLLAGPIAEFHAADLGKVRTAVFARTDDIEWDMSREMVTSGFKTVVRQMDDYVRDRWASIERIAEALAERGEIDGGAELDALIEEEIASAAVRS
jgi:hypothetical protein